MSTEDDIKDAVSRLAKGRRVRYASVCWLCQEPVTPEKIEIWFGWSIPTADGSVFHSGSWSLLYEGGLEKEATSIHTHVEEARGVIFPHPSPSQAKINEIVERLIADHLHLFMNRALLGRCPALVEKIAPDVLAADALLVLGPKLPKFVGRACYSLFSRAKTLAIMAPDRLRNEAPSGKYDKWEADPYPALWDDYAVRRWKTAEAGTGSGGSFELVVPTGDGIVTRKLPDGIGPFPPSGVMWKEKAKSIQEIFASEAHTTRFPIWHNQDITIPRGMVKAVAAAATHGAFQAASEQYQVLKKKVAEAGAPEDKLLFDGIGKVMGGTPQRLHNIVFMKVWDAQRKTDSGPAERTVNVVEELELGTNVSRGRKQRAAYPMGSAWFEEKVNGAKEKVKEAFGEKIFKQA